MDKKKKIIVYSVSLIITLLLIIIGGFYSVSNDSNIEEEIIKLNNIEDLAVSYLDKQDFQSAHKYYDEKLQLSLSNDEIVMYKVRKAFALFVEGESKNEQEIYFDKGKFVLDTILDEEYLEFGEYYRVLGYGFEILRFYDKALLNYELALKYSSNEEHYLTIIGGIAHTYMLLGNPYQANTYLKLGLEKDNENLFLNSLYFRNSGTLGDYKKSVEIGEKLVTKITNIEDLSEIYYALSNLAILEGDKDNSLKYVKKCLEVKEDYGLCYLSRSRIYFYMGGESNYSLAMNDINKAISYSPKSSIIMEQAGYINETIFGNEKAIITHKNNLNIILDSDTNLFDNEKNNLKQRLLINLSRLYSKNKDLNNSRLYFSLLKKESVNIFNLVLLEKELIKKDGGDFKFLLENTDLSDYMSIWKINKFLYQDIECTTNETDSCTNSSLYNDMYNILFVEQSFRKIDLGFFITIENIKNKCNNNIEILDNTVNSMCKVFLSSHKNLLIKNSSKKVDVETIFTK